MSKIDCGSFIDEYSPLLRATLGVSEFVLTKEPIQLKNKCEDIIEVSNRLTQEHPEMVSTDIVKMIRTSAEGIIGIMDSAQKQEKPIPYNLLSNEGIHLEMLTLEAMILDTARCVAKTECICQPIRPTNHQGE